MDNLAADKTSFSETPYHSLQPLHSSVNLRVRLITGHGISVPFLPEIIHYYLHALFHTLVEKCHS